jgi:hypothetical protein
VNYSGSGPPQPFLEKNALLPRAPGTHTPANPTRQRRSVRQRQITHLEKNYDWQLPGEVCNKLAAVARRPEDIPARVQALDCQVRIGVVTGPACARPLPAAQQLAS